MVIARRRFLAGLGGAVVGPMAARAQPMRVVGYLNTGGPVTAAKNVAAFRRGLKEAGYVEAQNITIEYRWAEGQYSRLPTLVADLVERQVAVLFVSGAGGMTVEAARKGTTAIPIVFVGGFDPIQLGVVASMNKPGGNVTGVTFLANFIEAKRLGLLHELVPQAGTLAVLVNPTNASAAVQLNDVRAAAQTLGLKLLIGNASVERDFDLAFKDFVRAGAEGVLVATDSFYFQRRERLVEAATRVALPVIYQEREFAAAGGLMSYGASIADAFQSAGSYAGRILKGEKPADIPVLQSSKFELVINLRTVKALGLTVSPGLLAIADEVIE